MMLSSACEKIVDFQASAYQPKLTLYGALFADSLPQIMVGRTQTYYGWVEGNAEPPFLEGADVRLSGTAGSESLVLGAYRPVPFDIWEGLFPGLGRNPNFHMVEAPDARFRYYEGATRLKAGTWYDFSVEAGEDNALRECYIPFPPTDVSAEVLVKDTAYRQEARSQYDRPVNIVSRQFYLLVRYQVRDSVAEIMHRPFVKYRQVIEEYLIRRDENVYERIEDTLSVDFARYSWFLPVSEPGVQEAIVGLGSYEIRSYDQLNGGIDLDSVPNLPMSRGDGLEVMRGGSKTIQFQVQGMLSHNRAEAEELRSSLFRQNYVSTDPLSFTEPTILAADGANGLGFVGGFSVSTPIVVEVTFE